MVSDEVGKQLHDRATRGEPLSAEEQVLLEDWYAAQDEAEAAQLGLNTNPINPLQAHIDSALAQLASSTERIQTINKENETLRGENADLRSRLGTPIKTQRLSGHDVSNWNSWELSDRVRACASELVRRRSFTFDEAICFMLEEAAWTFKSTAYNSARELSEEMKRERDN
jgi:hypothetical protein